jgi:hypothetical protein
MRDLIILFIHPRCSAINCSSSIAGASVRPTCAPRIASPPLRLFMSPARILRSAIVLKPSTLLHLYQELIDAVVAMKRRNPSWGCPRIASSMIYQFALVTCKSGDWRL